MKVLVTGASGQLGSDVIKELKMFGDTAVGVKKRGAISDDFIQLDITDKTAVERAIEKNRPDAVIHCAAWTAVDAAEIADNRNTVRAVNVSGTKNIADCCAAIGAKMMYISTDYVFSGEGKEPWKPDSMQFGPLNEYGKSKLEGEFAVGDALEHYFIVRTSWIFGANGENFVKTMLRLGKARDSVRVVNDQIGTPTYTLDLARLMVDMIHTDKYGTYHVTNEGGYTSWYGFCREIYQQSGIKTRVIPVSTEEYGVSIAKRPLNSRMDKSKLKMEGFQYLPEWKNALNRYLVEIGEI